MNVEDRDSKIIKERNLNSDGYNTDFFDIIVKSNGKEKALEILELFRTMTNESRTDYYCWMSRYAYTGCPMLSGKSYYDSFYAWKDYIKNHIIESCGEKNE